jgi:hypothetical protein
MGGCTVSLLGASLPSRDHWKLEIWLAGYMPNPPTELRCGGRWPSVPMASFTPGRFPRIRGSVGDTKKGHERHWSGIRIRV